MLANPLEKTEYKQFKTNLRLFQTYNIKITSKNISIQIKNPNI